MSEERDITTKLILAGLILLVSASLMEFAIVSHVWGAQALVWLLVAKWILIVVFDLPAASTPERPNG